jgi:hypothetical protein
VFTRGIQNTTPALKHVSTFHASGDKQQFVASAKSASGTTFIVHGQGRALTLSCHPADVDCAGGHWAGPATLAMPAIAKITLAERQNVRTALMNNVDHYQDLFLVGAWALGEKQYSNAFNALHALSVAGTDPSTFANYRQRFDPENDTSFLGAFEKAQKVYNAQNEPAAMGTWRDDMSNVTSALDGWVEDAVSWQIKQVSDSTLAADENTFERDISKASADVHKITGLPVKDPTKALKAAEQTQTTTPSATTTPQASTTRSDAVANDTRCYHGRDDTDGIPCTGITNDPNCSQGTDARTGYDCSSPGQAAGADASDYASGTAQPDSGPLPALKATCVGGSLASVGISCGFVGRVLYSLQDAYFNGRNPIPQTITAWSDATKKNYTLTCQTRNSNRQVLCSIDGEADTYLAFSVQILYAN